MISTSESTRATKSQPGIRSLQRRIFGMMDLLARQGEGTWRDARRIPRTSQSREADSFVKRLRHQNVAAGKRDGHVRSERESAGFLVAAGGRKMGKRQSRGGDTGGD